MLEVNFSDLIPIPSLIFVCRSHGHDIWYLCLAVKISLSIIIAWYGVFLIYMLFYCLFIDWCKILLCGHILTCVYLIVNIYDKFGLFEVWSYPERRLFIVVFNALEHLIWIYKAMRKYSIHQVIVWGLVLSWRTSYVIWNNTLACIVVAVYPWVIVSSVKYRCRIVHCNCGLVLGLSDLPLMLFNPFHLIVIRNLFIVVKHPTFLNLDIFPNYNYFLLLSCIRIATQLVDIEIIQASYIFLQILLNVWLNLIVLCSNWGKLICNRLLSLNQCHIGIVLRSKRKIKMSSISRRWLFFAFVL